MTPLMIDTIRITTMAMAVLLIFRRRFRLTLDLLPVQDIRPGDELLHAPAAHNKGATGLSRPWRIPHPSVPPENKQISSCHRKLRSWVCR